MDIGTFVIIEALVVIAIVVVATTMYLERAVWTVQRCAWSEDRQRVEVLGMGVWSSRKRAVDYIKGHGVQGAGQYWWLVGHDLVNSGLPMSDVSIFDQHGTPLRYPPTFSKTDLQPTVESLPSWFVSALRG